MADDLKGKNEEEFRQEQLENIVEFLGRTGAYDYFRDIILEILSLVRRSLQILKNSKILLYGLMALPAIFQCIIGVLMESMWVCQVFLETR